MDFYIELSEEEFEKVKNLDSSLGMWLWNIGVMLAPYDTGNLRTAITLASNTSKKINVRYNTMRANYIKFLEEGLGPVKKYKGFIDINTRIAMVEAIIQYLKTGKSPMFTGAPTVVLRQSQSIFSQEKPFLRMANMKTSVINPKVRGKISRIREMNYRRSIGMGATAMIGQRVETITDKSQKIKGSTRGISTLNAVYNQIRKGL